MVNQLSLGITKKPKIPKLIKQSEHELMTWCIEYLNLRGNHVQRVNVTGGQRRLHEYTLKNGIVKRYQTWVKGLEQGTPDIIGFSRTGIFIGLEVKIKPNKPTTEQELFIETARKCGCIAEVIYSQEQLMKVEGI